MHAQPAETDPEGHHAERDEDVGSKRAEIGVRADDEEDGDLDGEGDAVAEQDDAVGRAGGAGEEDGVVVGSADGDGVLAEEVLGGCRGEVEEVEALLYRQ